MKFGTTSQNRKLGAGHAIVASLVLVTSVACNSNKFGVEKLNHDKSVPVEPTPTPVPVTKTSESFVQDANGNKVDILVINDNSLSMYEEQTKLGQRFSSFVSGISDIDYQIAMTTTDLESPQFNQGGRLLEWTGTTSKVLTPSTPNADLVFQNTIMRPETLNCDGTVFGCPASNEQPLLATIRAFQQRNAANAGFFRSKIPLVVIVLSDEDEQSENPAGSTSPVDLIESFKTEFGFDKRLMFAGILIKEGDTACQAEQQAQEGGTGKGFFGTAVTDLASLTGGDTISICEADYGTSLAELSRRMRRLVTTFELAKTPKAGTVEIKFTPAVDIDYQVDGKTVIFDAPPPAGTRVDITYEQE